ncbi:hypothetical protein VNO77_04412 [Canavalia gladiata]|uniref:Uncharacterized protein n=1 Tax=Canavalia gladiata TaxID=3824 RepID=A0AAN9N1L6_CANGL
MILKPVLSHANYELYSSVSIFIVVDANLEGTDIDRFVSGQGICMGRKERFPWHETRKMKELVYRNEMASIAMRLEFEEENKLLDVMSPLLLGFEEKNSVAYEWEGRLGLEVSLLETQEYLHLCLQSFGLGLGDRHNGLKILPRVEECFGVGLDVLEDASGPPVIL